ncbi:MAG: sugar ABC transporter permease [Firmicutes bacterium]|nr:sugar ABC transporter permease [Bacillota bacterium]
MQEVVKRRFKLSDSVVAYLFILPFLISFIVFFLIPAAYSLVLSFYKYKGYGEMRFVGLQNYVNLLKYKFFWKTIDNTFFYFFAHLVPVMVISFLLALAVKSKYIGEFSKVYKPIIFLPQMTAIVAASLIWRVIFSTKSGVINQIIRAEIPWLEDTSLMRWSVVVLVSWRAIGWFMVIFLAGLTSISDEVIEASIIDGANPFQRMTRILLPLMKPFFSFAFFMDIIGSLKIFAEPNLLISGKDFAPPEAASIINILVLNLRDGNFGMASAVGWLLFLTIFIITMMQLKLFKEAN